MEPMFSIASPQRQTWKKGRQVAGTTSAVAKALLFAGCLPNFNALLVTLENQHAEELVRGKLNPLLHNSPWLMNKLGDNDTMSFKSFTNGSRIRINYLINNPDRVRGPSADLLLFDEAQNMSLAGATVAWSTLAASQLDLTVITGTPNTSSSFLEQQWRLSSQAEWAVWCEHCNGYNIPSLAEHLLYMLGDEGPICGRLLKGTDENGKRLRCRKPVNPDHEKCSWVHSFPDRRRSHSGYHTPQVIFPVHFTSRLKWQTLLEHRDVWPKAEFYNDVLGETCDVGVKDLTEKDLIKICQSDVTGDFKSAVSRSRKYDIVFMGVDWGGKGEARRLSKTAISVLGRNPGGKFELIWGKILGVSANFDMEMATIAKAFKAFKCRYLCHDYAAGAIYEWAARLTTSIPKEKILGFEYLHAPSGPVMQVKEGAKRRKRYVLDKTRAVKISNQAIKNEKIAAPKWEMSQELLLDFLAIEEERRERTYGGETVLMVRNPDKADDFVHATTFALHGICWYYGKIIKTENVHAYILNGMVSTSLEDILRLE
jgi:hypothetical protein